MRCEGLGLCRHRDKGKEGPRLEGWWAEEGGGGGTIELAFPGAYGNSEGKKGGIRRGEGPGRG